MKRFSVLASFLLMALVAVTCAPAVMAQAWPSKPVRIIVTFPPGGASDVVARLLAPRLAGSGDPWIVENRPGADGMIGAELVARAPSDGYTLLMANVGPQAIAPAIHRKIVRYDPKRDFTYIAHVGANAHVLLVNPSLPARSLKEFIALAKKRPGEVNFGAGGPINQLIGELLKVQAGIKIIYVPYKGSMMALQELRGGQIPAAVGPLPGSIGHVRAGSLRALAVTSEQRSPLAPDIPSFAEQGFPDLVVENWVGLAGPAKLNPGIVSQIAAGAEKALAVPDLRKRMKTIGVTPVYMNSAKFDAYVAKEIGRWRAIVDQTGAQVN